MKSISTINNARNKLKQLSGQGGKNIYLRLICAPHSCFESKSRDSGIAREGLKLINKQIAIVKCWQGLMCIIIIPNTLVAC